VNKEVLAPMCRTQLLGQGGDLTKTPGGPAY
jgi:hypothetical protein